MRNGKHMSTRRMKKRGSKTLVTILALSLALCSAVGGTMAWLMSETSTVTNTFTYGGINITLEETKVNPDGQPVDGSGSVVTDIQDAVKTTTGNEYNMVPGKRYLKDPALTVKSGSENSWLFVKIEESFLKGEDSAATVGGKGVNAYLSYTVAAGWTALEGVSGVYYREVSKDAADQTFAVLADNQVTVKEAVTVEMLEALGGYKPSLKLTGYAVQRDMSIDAIDSAAEAWALISESGN